MNSTTTVTTELPVFVYGTLRNGEHNYDWALAGRTTNEQPATLADTIMYSAGGFPYCTPNTDPTTNHSVVGELMTIHPDKYTETLNGLDRLEGYDADDDDNHYDRVIIDVTLADGTTVTAYTYLVGTRYDNGLNRLPVVPNGDWLAYDNPRFR